MACNTLKLDGVRTALLRRVRGWSRDVLSTRSKVSVDTIGRIERGKPCYPNTAGRIAVALEVRLIDLLDQSIGGLDDLPRRLYHPR